MDFNTNLIERTTKVRGANYFAVHSNKEFKKRMNEEFKYMVSPLLFDLNLTVSTEGNQFVIDEIYGSNQEEKDKNETSANLMSVKSLFPSPANDDNETKGSIIILKLKKNGKNAKMQKNEKINIRFSVSYNDKTGKTFKNDKYAQFGNDEDNECFDTKGVRKGILLSRFVEICKDWIRSTMKTKNKNTKNENVYNPEQSIQDSICSKFTSSQYVLIGDLMVLGNDFNVIIMAMEQTKISDAKKLNEYITSNLSEIRKSALQKTQKYMKQKNIVSEEYAVLFDRFIKYFKDEMLAIDDKTLYKELEILQYLRNNGMKTNIYNSFSVRNDDGIYYEAQDIGTATCFQHALNMYFQRQYVTKQDFKEIYCEKLRKHKDKIIEIKKPNSNLSFYGKNQNEESSKIEDNYDLNGYWELYTMSSIENIIETLKTNDFKKLAPNDAMFLLEFQMDSSNDNKMIYVPHRLYHRHARAQDMNDQIQSKKMFIDALKSEHKIDRIYLTLCMQ